MSEARVRKRKPVRHKQMRDVERQLTESMGLEVDMSSAFIELAHFEGNDILILDRKIVAMNMEIHDSRSWVPTVSIRWEQGSRIRSPTGVRNSARRWGRNDGDDEGKGHLYSPLDWRRTVEYRDLSPHL